MINNYREEEDLDDEFCKIEEVNHEYIELKENVEKLEHDLDYAVEELEMFYEDNKEIIL